MNRTSVLCLVVAVALLSGGCASSGSSAGQMESSRDLAEMKERILELQEQAAVAEVEMERLRTQVNQLEKRLAGGASESVVSSRSIPAERSTAMPSPPVRTPEQSSIEESDLAPERAVTPAAGSEASESTAVAGAESAAQTETTALQPVDPAAQALYDRGYTLYHQGKYLDAEASFQRFLQAYPSTELSDNAQFWIGESRYARGDIRGALAAFREVLQKYPDGNKVPDALIKEGDCLEKLGDRDGARDRYQEVKRRFPDSGAAVMADDRLAGLDG